MYGHDERHGLRPLPSPRLPRHSRRFFFQRHMLARSTTLPTPPPPLPTPQKSARETNALAPCFATGNLPFPKEITCCIVCCTHFFFCFMSPRQNDLISAPAKRKGHDCLFLFFSFEIHPCPCERCGCLNKILPPKTLARAVIQAPAPCTSHRIHPTSDKQSGFPPPPGQSVSPPRLLPLPPLLALPLVRPPAWPCTLPSPSCTCTDGGGGG